MRWSRFFVFCLLSFFAGFLFLSFNVNNVSAVSDISYTVDNDNKSTDYTLCSDCSSDYNYIYIQPTVFPLSNFNGFYSLRLYLAGRITYNVPVGAISGILLDFSDEFPSSVEYIYYSGLNPFFQSLHGTIVITLLENNPFGFTPSGSMSIIENGTYDVTNYAEAVVNVPAEVIQGDYHDDLVSINNSILVCGAILLVLYFFYCIYRMIIKTAGGH